LRVWLENRKVVDGWNLGHSTAPTGTFSFSAANELYDLKVEFRSPGDTSSAHLRLKWQNTASGVAGQDTSYGLIRSTRLYYRYDVRDRCKTFSNNGCGGNADGVYGDATDGTSREIALVHPATVCASASLATGNPLSESTVGSAMTFTVTARDAYENVRTLNGDVTFSVDLHGSGGLPVYQGSVATLSGDDGRYAAAYTVTAAKNYELFVKYGNDNARDSPFTMAARPRSVSGSQSTITGSGLTAAAILAKSAFTVQARDTYANSRTRGGDVFAVRVVRTSTSNPRPEEADGTASADTLHGTHQITDTSDGRYAGYYEVPSSGNTGSHYLHASLVGANGVWATYYNDKTSFAEAAVKANVQTFTSLSGGWAFGGTEPYCNLGTSADYRIRWQGFFKPSADGGYTFKLDDGSASGLGSVAKLWVDNKLHCTKAAASKTCQGASAVTLDDA